LEKAAAQHQILINHAPSDFASYKALYRIYRDTKQYDKAWCVAAALSYLKKADVEEQQFYTQYQKAGGQATHQVTDEIWQRYIYHPDEDPYVGAIFAGMMPSVSQLDARPLKAFKEIKLKRKDRLPFGDTKLLFSKVFSHVTQVLGVQQADLYLKSERPVGLQFAHTTEAPTFVVGGDILRGRREPELTYLIAKELTYMRSQHFLCKIRPATSQLRAIFFTALRLVRPQFTVPPADQRAVDELAKVLAGRVQPLHLEQMATLVDRFVTGQSEINLKRWVLGVERTAMRMAFVLCGDLDTAGRMIRNEPVLMGAPTAKDKLKELILYSVSEEYFAVRKQLGLTIDQALQSSARS
jgi:hypothetical protein